jgi:hypothetical protein
VIASYTTGKLLDHDYRVTARKLGLGPKSQTNGNFPFAKARLRSIFPVIVTSSVATASYGWIIQSKAHIAALLVVQFFSGVAQVCIFATCRTLLTDLNPGRSSTGPGQLQSRSLRAEWSRSCRFGDHDSEDRLRVDVHNLCGAGPFGCTTSSVSQVEVYLVTYNSCSSNGIEF